MSRSELDYTELQFRRGGHQKEPHSGTHNTWVPEEPAYAGILGNSLHNSGPQYPHFIKWVLIITPRQRCYEEGVRSLRQKSLIAPKKRTINTYWTPVNDMHSEPFRVKCTHASTHFALHKNKINNNKIEWWMGRNIDRWPDTGQSKSSNMIFVDSKWWVHGYWLQNSFAFSICSKNF